eukprot:TRINITY_DN9419_c0_g1_i1.p1 TRINITY_DN9419_c0_g1~~TRINITY_DN9419_c0_g1_i1.p1  ORF type:complete len:476 (+),score=125.46 TRINITY_DN9419_c0_g1_i1:61-1428(+)
MPPSPTNAPAAAGPQAPARLPSADHIPLADVATRGRTVSMQVSSGAGSVDLPCVTGLEEPMDSDLGSPLVMARRGSLLGKDGSAGGGAELSPFVVQSGSDKVYPGPDHEEPLMPHEKWNIANGYLLGFALLAIAIALDWSEVAADLSDWAQRLDCADCPRHPSCADGKYVVTPGPSNVTDDDGDNVGYDYIDCPSGLDNWMTWIGTLGAVGFNILLSYGAGRLHLRSPKVWKVNYTRKVSHFAMFMMQILVRYVVSLEDHTIETVSTLIVTSTLYMMVYHAVLLKPFRKRFYWARVVFASLDRPEDRPYTLRWLTTQNIAYYAVFTPLMYCLIAEGSFHLYLIPTLVVGLGDGLAEPVGVRWGKHKYRTRAVWYDNKCCAGEFTRSLEGSACVFIVTVISIAIMTNSFTGVQLAVAYATLPISLTLSEAFAPHTWDTPFLFGVGGTGVLLISVFV